MKSEHLSARMQTWDEVGSADHEHRVQESEGEFVRVLDEPDRPVGNNECAVGPSSPLYSPIADSVSNMDELIDTVETVEIVDGVRARLRSTFSDRNRGVDDSIVDDSGRVAAWVVGVAQAVEEEMFVRVGAMEVVREEGDEGLFEGSSGGWTGGRTCSESEPIK